MNSDWAEVGAQERWTKTMITKRITTRTVPKKRTLRATPGVEPARAFVAVSTIGGSELRASAILPLSRNHCSRGQRAVWNRVPDYAAGTVAASKNSAWAIAALTVERWNGLVVRKGGSGRGSPSSRSREAVM